MIASMHLYAFIVLFSGGVILTIGDIVFKYWMGHSHPLIYAAGFVLYMIGLVLLIKSYQYQNIAVASTIFELVNVVTLAIVSWLLFKEGLTHTQLGGVFLAIVAVFMLEFGGK